MDDIFFARNSTSCLQKEYL